VPSASDAAPHRDGDLIGGELALGYLDGVDQFGRNIDQDRGAERDLKRPRANDARPLESSIGIRTPSNPGGACVHFST
jgi:hypothetical protein